MGNGIDGNGRRTRGPSSARRAQLAEARRCPQCGRGAALSRYDDGVLIGMTCRWCGHTNLREQAWIAAGLPSPASGAPSSPDPATAQVRGIRGETPGGENR